MNRHDPRVEGYEPDRPEEFTATDDDFEAADQLERLLESEREIVKECDQYYYGEHRKPYMPKESSKEYEELARRSITNMVPLIIGNLAQLLNVEGYMASNAGEDDKNAKPWAPWQANRMALKQRQVFRGALDYGSAYTVKSGADEDKIRGKYPSIRVVSPSRMIAGYEDPVNDEYPLYALELLETAKRERKFRLYKPDGSWVNLRKALASGSKFEELSKTGVSGLPYPPVTRYVYDMDLDGRYVGEIRQMITLQDRLNQTVMDRLLVQTYGSYKVKYATGLVVASDEERLRWSQSRMMIAEDEDTHFGSLPETPLDGFIKSVGIDQETIAAVSAIPPHYLTGELNNLGAEAIVEARASTEAKVGEIRRALGEAVKQDMRDLAYLMGDSFDSGDYDAQVIWADPQNRSLSQVADALGKLAAMLEVPVTELWKMIPGVTNSDAKRWAKIREQEAMERAIEQAEQDAQEFENDNRTTPNTPEQERQGVTAGSQ